MYPLCFHVFEILTKKSAFVLIFHLQSKSKSVLLQKKLFQSLFDIVDSGISKQLATYCIEIMLDLLREPEARFEPEVLALFFQCLTSKSVQLLTLDLDVPVE
jgi:hypothetical protein